MKSSLKTALSWVFFTIVVFGLGACGGSDAERSAVFSSVPGASPAPDPSATPSPDPTASPVPTPDMTPTPSPTVTPTPSPTVTPTPSPTVTPTPSPSPTPVAFAEVQAVFEERCVECHAGAAPSGGMGLDDATTSFNNLVMQPSIQRPALFRVNPGNPDDSYLVRKIEGGPDIMGVRMPFDGPPYLTTEQISLIRTWIAEGATQDPAVMTSARVLSTQVEDEVESVTFKVLLSAPVNESSLAENGIQVYKLKDSQSFLAAGEELSLDVEGRLLQVSYRGDMLNIDGLALQINDTALSAVLDNQGRLLDGDGDLQDGGVYRFVYPF